MGKKIKYSALGLLFSIIIAITIGTPTVLIANPFIKYHRMVPATWIDYFLWITISVAIGTYFSYFLYNRNKSMQKHDSKVFGGALFGILSIGCPICNVLLVSIFGPTLLLAFFDPLRPALGIAAILLIGSAIHFMKSDICRECK